MPARFIRGSIDDPISLALKPPPDETPEQREKRIYEEQVAQKISDEIDAQLKRDKSVALAEKKKKSVRVLLLGQSESGKSTLLKNFQLVWAPKSWKEERLSWRSVVYLNIVNSTLKILSVLFNPPDVEPSSTPQLEAPLNLDLDSLYSELFAVQKILKRRLGAGTDEPGDYRSGSISVEGSSVHEFFVRSDKSWKERLFSKRERPSTEAVPSPESEEDDEVKKALLARKSDIQQLWGDTRTRKTLLNASVNLEETPGFFMDDLDRILVQNYEPSDDDVVRARLRTMGIQEHKFLFESGAEVGREWRIYDVGGSRPQRASWFSFFDNVNAVIFLVPVNCFDEVLDEDRKVNRLEDSFDLWKAICRSPLLAKAQLILFLNKTDLLDRKLQAGVSFARYVPSFGERPNDRDTVCRYLRNQFKDIQNRYSPIDRPFNSWFTCATDTKATEKTLVTVRYGIMKENFAKAELV